MLFFEATVYFNKKIPIQNNLDKVYFTEDLCVYYSHKDGKYDIVGHIFETDTELEFTTMQGYFLDNSIGNKLYNTIASKQSTLKPILSGMVFYLDNKNEQIDKIIIDGFTLEDIKSNAIKSNIKTMEIVYN